MTARRAPPGTETRRVEPVGRGVRAKPADGAFHVEDLRRKNDRFAAEQGGLRGEPVFDARDGDVLFRHQAKREPRHGQRTTPYPAAAVDPDHAGDGVCRASARGYAEREMKGPSAD